MNALLASIAVQIQFAQIQSDHSRVHVSQDIQVMGLFVSKRIQVVGDFLHLPKVKFPNQLIARLDKVLTAHFEKGFLNK